MREAMLILHFIGLAMGLGTSFAHAFLAIATSKMSTEEATRFQLNSLVLSYMGYAGIVLLIISGLYLIIPYWPIITSFPLLIIKLVLVLILIILLVFINILSKKARKGNAEVELRKMEKLGKMTLIIGVLIVILAVNIFH